SSVKSYAIVNPNFGDEYRYMIYSVNISKAGIKGPVNGLLYKSSTPPPPTFNSASKLRRVVETNDIITNAPTHTYFKTQFGSDNAIRSVGAVTRVWITSSKVGDVELVATPKSPDTQTSYNFYRRKKGSSDLWTFVTNIAQEADPDNPLNVVKQVVYDTNFTAAQYKGSGGKSIETFYPLWEYLVTAINGSQESALSIKTNEGQAIDPLDILPAPSYLSVPFHYAFATGISAFTGYWTVTAGVPATTGSVQIVGMGGSTTEYQKMYLTWGGVRADGHIAGQTFDYDVRHAKPGKDYSLPDEWYHHGGINGNTSIKLDNQEDGAYKTGLYTIVDSGIAAAIAGIYSPESAAFAVSATNKKAFGLDGDTIGILFEESPQNPYGSSLPASTGVAGSLLGNNVYPYELRITWNAVEKAAGYQLLVATDADIYTGFGKIITNYNRVDGASADPITTTDRVYHYIPEDEFVLGRKYYFILATVNSNGVLGGTTPMTYTHNRPYKPTLSTISTNKVFYTTNYTTGLDVGTYVSNTYFEENGFKFEPFNRKLGSVVRMWEIIAEGDRIQMDLSYPRFTTLPRGYSLYRATSTNGPWTKISVYIPWEAPLAKVTYVDKVPSPGKYYYTVAAVYNDIEGATNSVSEDTVGVAVNNSYLSPAPSYLTIPHLWAFGSGGYKGSIFATKDTHQGGEQIAGGQSKGNYTWITWGAITNGSSPKYALYRGLTTAHTATEPVMLTKRNLLTGANATKLELPSGDVGLYNSSETNRANYIQHSLSLEVAISNTFTNFFGEVVTVQSGSRGIEFYESRDPYTDTALDAPTGGVAAINKNTYVTQKMYTVDLSWYRSQGAQGYTIMLKNLGDNTTSFLTNISILTGDPASFHLSTPTTNLSLGSSYEYLIIATNFNPPQKGGTNVVPYTHVTPLPPVVRSVSTNARGEVTNLVGRNETLRVYWGVTSASSMITGRVIQRWTISLEDKGAIRISWDKNPSGETPDYYKIYRTSRPNSSGDLAMDSMSSWQSPKLLGTVMGTQSLTWRDDLTETTSLADRRGSGTPFKYPMYYYRITGVKRLANGTEVESLPSYFTNLSTGAT
ncbi:MAG: hypothetical protein ACRCY4_03665, partial [Brevinema sp.]